MRVYSLEWILAMAWVFFFGRKGGKVGGEGNWPFSYLMRNLVSKLPSGFLLSSSTAYQSRMLTTGSGEMSTSFGKTISTKQNKPCHFMLIQSLIPTAVWWGSQELNWNPNTNTPPCQERAHASLPAGSFQHVLSSDEYSVLERVQTYATLILQIYLSYKNNLTCLEMWMGKWGLGVETYRWVHP